MSTVFSGCRRSQPGGRTSEPSHADASSGQTLWLTANGLRLKTKIYTSAKTGSSPALILVLHGDSPFGPPSYQYAFAQKLATELDNAVVVALLRPGYTDNTGEHSEGERGRTTGDNYTPQVVDAVAAVITQLRARFHPACTVVIGHSGGAAIAADLLGRWPSVVNAALLVSCPCDLERWRRHMLSRQYNPIWLLPVHSISPMSVAERVSPSVNIRMMVGSQDEIAPSSLTEEYAALLKKRGDNVAVVVAPGLPHDILLEPAAFAQARQLVEDCRRAR